MVKIDELPEDIQKKIRDFFKSIENIDNRPTHNGLGPIYLNPVYYSISLLKEFINGDDSYRFLHNVDEIRALLDFLDENNHIELLRDLLEIEYKLNKLPMDSPCYAD